MHGYGFFRGGGIRSGAVSSSLSSGENTYFLQTKFARDFELFVIKILNEICGVGTLRKGTITLLHTKDLHTFPKGCKVYIFCIYIHVIGLIIKDTFNLHL
jgi:hypothetical protein